MRRTLGGLPPVDPPSGFFPDLVRRVQRRAQTLVAAGVALTAAVIAIGVGVETGIDEHAVSPDLRDLVEQHEAAASESAAPAGDFARADRDDPPAPYWAPDDLAGSFHATGTFADGDVLHVAYTDGTVEVSLFEEPGDLDHSAVQREHLSRVGEGEWMMSDGPVVAVVVERDDMVYTVVGRSDAETMAEMAEMAEAFPGSQSMSVVNRLQEVGDDFVEIFSLG